MTFLERKILEELAKAPAMSFARFMELALYCPDYGFYEKEPDTIGKGGHFYTSVSIGKVFGELLAFRFAQWLGEAPTMIVEAGAHDGRLALDVLDWLQHYRPALYANLTYCLIESSSRRRSWQEQTLAVHSGKTRWLPDLLHLRANGGTPRIIFSNELLDAFPVHVLRWNSSARKWIEMGVAHDGQQYCWMPLGQAPAEVGPFLPEQVLCPALPDGYQVEISPSAIQWWKQAAQLPGIVRLLTFDYGFSAEDRWAAERQSGTLRAYDRHRSSLEVLHEPGERDITAHVDFPALKAAGEAAGLVTAQYTTQGRYLSKIAADAGPDWHWTPERTHQFQTLTHPDHLGASFKVLEQAGTVPLERGPAAE